VLVILVLGGCFNQSVDDAAVITINLNRSAGLTAYSTDDDEIWSRLIFIIELSGPSTVPSVKTKPGTQTINISVPPGSYDIMATAFLEGEVYARGSASAQARVGYLTSVPLILYSIGENVLVINKNVIEGVTVPVTGGTPVINFSENEQYSGTVTWSPPVSKTFEPFTDYTATITLIAKTGFTLQGVEDDFFTVAGAVSTSNSSNSGIITAVFQKTYEDITINITAITGITVPVTGEKPGFNIDETPQYTGSVIWSPSDLTSFASATQYTATITLIPKDGYTSKGVTANLFKVAKASSVRNDPDSCIITVVFPKTATTISITAIAGVTVPKVGDIPVTKITETPQYTGTISWKTAGVEHTGVFVDYNVYTAIITLTSKAGYTFKGVATNSFTVAGASSINSANSEIITATFPLIPYALGDTGPGGGKVFYFNAAGFTMTDTGEICHYLEASPVDMSERLTWATTGFTNSDILTDIAIGTGRNNTALILNTDANAPAAKACRDYRCSNNLSDWFLPSKDELSELYKNRFYVRNMGNMWYFSSSQMSSSTVWSKFFQDDDRWDSSAKGTSSSNYVRAIRAF
jgi:hypothetical protein